MLKTSLEKSLMNHKKGTGKQIITFFFSLSLQYEHERKS